MRDNQMAALEELIKDEVRLNGRITFARFVELALYHPEHGYYASGRAKIGRSGDFYTSPQATGAFGALLSEYFIKLKKAIGDDACAFVEMGAGEGLMARDFLTALGRFHPDDFESCRYVIVERSKGMAARQRESLGGLAVRVAWHGSVEELPDGETAVFFSNELVDAFPFHRVVQEGGSLKEIYVTLEGGRLVLAPGEQSTPEIARHLDRLKVRLPEGMTTEVRIDARQWIKAVGRKLGRGFVITIDYGYPAWDYYSARRMDGTFLCYYRHRANAEPLERIGEQDITAHVDFTALAIAGAEAGLTPVLFTDQSSFLLDAVGALEKSLVASGAPQQEMEKAALGVKTIIHPDWMGGAFKVLVQRKGAVDEGVFGRTKNRLEYHFSGETGQV
jgi:SAM-dependent MidA family methyltransferase